MPDVDLTRRRFLAGLAAAGLTTLSSAGAYATLFEPFNYELSETDIPVRDLPRGFDGFRVAQVTDVHHSRLVPLSEVRRVVDLTNGAQPDLIALTGDYVTSRRRYIDPCAEALSALKAPAGVWAVLGNHDHHVDAELMARALKRAGIDVLSNTNTVVRRGGDELQLAGLDDWGWGKADWSGALRGLDPARPVVLLSHEPAMFDAPEARRVSLMLSGHTHGGQICLPVIGAPASYLWPAFRYLRGRFERGGAQLYVSRGTGMIGVPVRLGAPPEVAVLTLRRAN